MRTITNTNNGNFATVINKGDYGFTVHFGYGDTCTGRKVFKKESTALTFANKYTA